MSGETRTLEELLDAGEVEVEAALLFPPGETFSAREVRLVGDAWAAGLAAGKALPGAGAAPGEGAPSSDVRAGSPGDKP